ncbi:MAG: hypothetical protein JWP89_3707 [Schlesneria sp.]|nr:hypothetical protein [Schlesneria sp.]
MYHFIMPPDSIEPRQVDALFRPQADHLRQRRYDVSLVSAAVIRGEAELRGIPKEATVVYRGWMLKAHEYQGLNSAVRRAGADLLTDPETYLLTHHLPNWYATLTEFTAETVVIEEADELLTTLRRLGWGSYFLKDFVKSLKVAGGSIVRSDADASRWLAKMIEYRDEVEGGICIRRVESFVPESERRYFVLNGVPHTPDESPIPKAVHVAAERIASHFFTVDIAMTVDNRCRIVELGDGQVSDLVGWSPERFAGIWPHE